MTSKLKLSRFLPLILVILVWSIVQSWTVVAQTSLDSLTDTPTAAMLATVVGIAAVVTVIINLARSAMKPEDFDRAAPIMSVTLGVILAVLGELQRGGSNYVDAALVGLFGGVMSQNANKVGVRTIQLIKNSPPE